ncbi:hypothetical protein [Brevibacterium antiquum]|uniref:Uncharacterized protein n=1 Tax=Brevibacterium antiquum TaxID=234835 RepID=A0A2H1IHB3_9MICO|nr:hypothetical protein [Brevibacterium antiquum]SMX74599.1 hypothetical protein BANT10_00886 [Brevibacterium antiquum]
MSDNPTDPTQRPDEPEMGAPVMDDPTLEEPTADELDDPELNAAEAEADDVDTALDADVESDAEASPLVEPGADGPEGTGIEGADDALLEDSGEDDELDAPDISGEFSTDSTTAAELGNRPGDEMVSDDEDEAEVAELAGDDLDVDALAGDDLDALADGGGED